MKALFEEHIETEIFKYEIKDYDLESKMEAKRNWNLMRMKLYFPGAFSFKLSQIVFDWSSTILFAHQFENLICHQSKHLLRIYTCSSYFQFLCFTIYEGNKL